MTKKKKCLLAILLSVVTVLLAVFIGWTVWGNVTIQTNRHRIKSERLPSVFSGFTIAQVSDLHNAEFGKDNTRLIEALENAEADMIVLTGDLVDSRRTDIDVALDFAKNATKIAPTYYVSGNHESRLTEKQYAALTDGLKAAGVTVLENESAYITHERENIRIIGVSDPDFTDAEKGDEQIMKETLGSFSFGEEYTVLLSHRPELFDVYADVGADLVFSGHAHGGQFRLPFVGGLFAPDQGIFPEYDAGRYTEGSTNMIVSRGLGNSLFPFRVNNRPELVVVTLENK